MHYYLTKVDQKFTHCTLNCVNLRKQVRKSNKLRKTLNHTIGFFPLVGLINAYYLQYG